jgi:hypothetical protein
MPKVKAASAKAVAATAAATKEKRDRAKAKAKAKGLPSRSSLLPDPDDVVNTLQVVATAGDAARASAASAVDDEENVNDAMTPGSASKRRRSNRRDVRDQAVRLAKQFLVPKFGQAVMGKVNKIGEEILQVIQDKLVELKGFNKYWTNQHWMELYVSFELTVPIANKLAKPPDSDDPPSDDVLEKLAIIHAKNPADRSIEPFEMYLLHLETDLTAREMFGILVACGESPIVVRVSHQRCYIAVLQYMGRIVLYIRLTVSNNM